MKATLLFTVVALVVVLTLYSLVLLPFMITEEGAMARFAQLLPDARGIEIVRATNNLPVFGDPLDVSYELRVDGKEIGAKCIRSSIFSDIVCRVYVSGSE